MRVIYVDASNMWKRLVNTPKPLAEVEIRIEVETGKISLTEKGHRPPGIKVKPKKKK